MSYKSLLNYTPSTLKNNDNYFSNFSNKTGISSNTTVLKKTIELFKKNPDFMKTYVTLVGYFNNYPVNNEIINKSKPPAMTLVKKNGGTDLLKGLEICLKQGTRYIGFSNNNIYYSDDNTEYSKNGEFKCPKCPPGMSSTDPYYKPEGCNCFGYFKDTPLNVLKEGCEKANMEIPPLNYMSHPYTCSSKNVDNNKLTVYRFDPSIVNLVYNTFWNINNANNGFNTSKNIMEGFSDSLYGDLTKYKNTMNNNWQTEYSDNIKNNQLSNVVGNLNSISSNLAKDYNKKTKIYNQQVDIINRNQKIVDDKNNLINNQLNSLQDLQNNISNKERLIELNKDNYTKDNRSIKLLGGAFIMFFALVIPIFLLLTKTISLNLGLLLILAIIIAYVIYAIIVSNKMKVLKFSKPLRKDISKYEKAISKFYKNDIRDKIANYAYGDCVCPEEEEENPNPNPGPDVPEGTIKFVLNQNDGFWYYDGSAPPQQIYPKPRGYVTIVGMGNMSNVPVKVPENLNIIQNKIERELLRLLKRKMEENDIPNNPKPLRIIDWISGANMGMSNSSKNTPSPVWNSIGLPKITSDRVLINKVCQSYDSSNTDSDIQTFIKEAYSLLLDEDIAQNIVNKNGIQENKLDYLTRKYGQIINKNGKEEAYNEVLMNIMESKEFIDKYGSNNTLDNLIVSIMIRYSTKSTNNYSFSSVYTSGINTNTINTGCESSEYGCCPDGKSYATGPNFEGCN